MSEIITTKRDTEINRLLERVIRDHRKDIAAYSKGHLNENNLWQPPESRRESWPTSKLPALRFKNRVKIEDTSRKDTMWEAVACFSAGSAFKCDLPDKLADSAKQEDTKQEDNINLEEFDASYMILPRGVEHSFQILPSIHGCLTKREEVEQRKHFENKIIEKQNLTDRGWYDGSRVKELLVRNFSSHRASKQLFDGLWDDLCKSCVIYQPLLTDIRAFYNGYLDKLNTDQVEEQVVVVAPAEIDPDIAQKNKEIRALQSQVEGLEVKAMELLNKKNGLQEELDITTAVLSEIQLTCTTSYSEDSGPMVRKLQVTPSRPFADIFTDSDISYTNNIGSQIETLRREILQQQAELAVLKSSQRRDMVPAEVYQCMIQCVQSSELEIQKQIKTIQVLEQKEQLMEEQLNSLFKTIDLTDTQCETLRGLKISLV